MLLQPFLKQVIETRQTLSLDQARGLLQEVLASPTAEPQQQMQLAALLAALATRGEAAAEIAGFASAVREAATPLPLDPEERLALVDACGTGGDSSDTFNISTAAALVAAAAGATVAKHGNRAVTSRSGSADVLEALGIPIDHTPESAVHALRTHRFAFLHAPSHHPSLRAVMPVRRALGVRTLFNIVGPLANPAGAARQVMGVYGAHLVPLVAEAMLLLGTRRALVVFGEAATPEHPSRGLDEFSLAGPTQVAEVREGAITYSTVRPEDLRSLGLQPAPLSALAGGDAAANAATLRAIFAGDPGPKRQIVLLNAAAILLTADVAPDLSAALTRATEAIDTGAVTRLIQSLAQSSSPA